jgi:hypothetical protein
MTTTLIETGIKHFSSVLEKIKESSVSFAVIAHRFICLIRPGHSVLRFGSVPRFL